MAEKGCNRRRRKSPLGTAQKKRGQMGSSQDDRSRNEEIIGSLTKKSSGRREFHKGSVKQFQVLITRGQHVKNGLAVIVSICDL